MPSRLSRILADLMPRLRRPATEPVARSASDPAASAVGSIAPEEREVDHEFVADAPAFPDAERQAAHSAVDELRQREVALSRHVSRLEDLCASIRQAQLLADRAQSAGDQAKASTFAAMITQLAAELATARAELIGRYEAYRGAADNAQTALAQAQRAGVPDVELPASANGIRRICRQLERRMAAVEQ
jgi:aspartate oxidase